MFRLTRQPVVWFTALLCWLGLLWFLSSLQGSQLHPLPIPQFDKLVHFGYFMVGGFLFAGGVFTKNPEQASWKTVVWTTVLVVALIGGLDEWHQCYTPGRSGGDPGDWLADLLGGTSGALLLKTIHDRLR